MHSSLACQGSAPSPRHFRAGRNKHSSSRMLMLGDSVRRVATMTHDETIRWVTVVKASGMKVV